MRITWYGVVLLMLLNVIFARLLFARAPTSYPELAQVAEYSDSFAHLKEFFQQTALRKGGEYAFALLRNASLPSGTDIHLLGHVIGDVLYQQKGKDGMLSCTQEFRNACSHSIVVGLFLDKGEAAIGEIAAACKAAPGAAGAYTMCFHGLGHGILAAAEYDFQRAAGMCGSVAPEGFYSREAVECVGGAVMELVSGGDHNKEAWERQSARYLSDTNPFAPCDASYLPDAGRGICYEYLTPHLFELAGSDLNDPTPDGIRQAFAFCQQLPQDSPYRTACFRGFGKELVNVVLKNDIRVVAQGIAKTQAQQMYDLCALAPEQVGRQQCLIHLVNSLYWGGENSDRSARMFCSVVPEAADRELCYAHLQGAISFYTN